jgi:pSer/pThr/pTyr-binding forkhead associated (FHA) protein
MGCTQTKNRLMEISVNTPKLILHTERGIESITLSDRSIWTFGRSKKNAVPITDPCASRYHAQIEIIGQFYYYVDLQSRNGSLVNDRPVTEPVLLKNGDRVSIGGMSMIFEHNLDTGPEKSAQPLQVLMLQSSALQGEVWQEILQTLKISVLWATSDNEFTTQIDLDAAANRLPQLLMIDVRAYNGNPYYFCRWCHNKYPNVSIILIDSSREEISNLECQVAIKSGAKTIFSGIQNKDLRLNYFKITKQVNDVLLALGNDPIKEDIIAPILRMLEDRSNYESSTTLFTSTPKLPTKENA